MPHVFCLTSWYGLGMLDAATVVEYGCVRVVAADQEHPAVDLVKSE